jgi:hypothetical protein
MMRWIWAGAMLALFLGFSFWYGGAGSAVSAEEGAERLSRIRAAYAAAGQSGQHPQSLDLLKAWIARDDGREFFMVNLETMRKSPEALSADAAYARAVLPALLRRGSFPIYAGRPMGSMLGEVSAKVDRVVVVRYRSLRDLLDMIEDLEMVKGLPHKFASLEHTESFPTRPIFTATDVRSIVGLVLGLLAVLGWHFLTARRK